jgi:hypothetical protein
MIWAGHVAHMVEMRNSYKILIGKFERKSHMEVLDEDGIIVLECILKEITCEGVDWI